MNLIICAIRDSATQAFARPIFVRAAGQAMRSFIDEVKRDDPTNDLHNHPTDFELYQLGTFDEQAGELKPHPPQLLMRGKDVSTLTQPES